MRKSGAIKIAPLFYKMEIKKKLIKKRHELLLLRDKCKYRSKVFVYRIKTWIRVFFVNQKPDYNKVALCKKLIVCAHPDDETLFFFSLMQKGTYVICLFSCGEKTRRQEFFQALDYQEAEGVCYV
jgi:hypothetical protein